jgi:archaeosine synthase beta-subunit
MARVLTVFLAGAECPFSCVFCDLWKHTLEGPTPPGALPAQLRLALAEPAVQAARPTCVKLYNASNFFEPRAVPPVDLPALAALVRPFARVVVESHPRLVDGARGFARQLDGTLEVAMGLETVHPEAARRLNKESLPDDFARAAEALRADGIDVRAFVLVGAPVVPPAEAVEWAVRSAAWALDHGAGVVSLIPLRGESFPRPTLEDLERALEEGLGLDRGIVLADLWDAAALAACDLCRGPRLERLARMNATGRAEPALPCCFCGHGPTS